MGENKYIEPNYDETTDIKDVEMELIRVESIIFSTEDIPVHLLEKKRYLKELIGRAKERAS